MDNNLTSTYEKSVLGRGKIGAASFSTFGGGGVSYEKDPKTAKLEYDVFSRLIEITGFSKEPKTTVKTNSIQTPSVEECVKELLQFQRDENGK